MKESKTAYEIIQYYQLKYLDLKKKNNNKK